MFRQILLLRHGKASSDPAGCDADRPLAERGVCDMNALAGWLNEQKIACDEVLVSSALRTRESWQALSAEWSHKGRSHIEEALYLASNGDLLSRLQALKNNVRSVMIIGHNPGLHQLGLTLSLPENTKRYELLELSFPTTALLQLEVQLTEWEELVPQTAKFEAYWTPRTGAAP